MTKNPKSWRDAIEVHPAAGLFPLMTADELMKALNLKIHDWVGAVTTGKTKDGTNIAFEIDDLIEGMTEEQRTEVIGRLDAVIRERLGNRAGR